MNSKEKNLPVCKNCNNTVNPVWSNKIGFKCECNSCNKSLSIEDIKWVPLSKIDLTKLNDKRGDLIETL